MSKYFSPKFFEDELVFQKVFQEKTTLVVQMLLLAGCIGVYFFITGAVLSYTLNYLAPSYNSFTQFSVLVKYHRTPEENQVFSLVKRTFNQVRFFQEKMAEYYIYLAVQSVHDQQKLGMTMYPISRMRTYLTGDAVGFEKQYAGIWQFDCKNKHELHEIEKFLQNRSITKRQFRDDGSSTEWCKDLSVLELETSIKTISSFVRTLTIEEITEIHKKAKQTGNKEEDNSDDLLSREFNRESLFAKFCNTFLPGKIPRRIQTELWSLFHEISVRPEHQMYRGIVQWPTGTGKTIATLMLIVLAKERCVQHDTIYRGLFVSPKNDILDTISKDFNKLSEFGITVYDGSHGRLSGLTVPTNSHILIYACQAALTMNEGMTRLPTITHCHYDEVHRITGDEYFKLLK
ncbi:MAG: DEAD/DEAH box helicase family protein, partial [Proteobacteria bacterium]|nr:DEAD/DEAH box helicase family protein [Pseudomonadota bacterium]